MTKTYDTLIIGAGHKDLTPSPSTLRAHVLLILA